VGNKDERRKAMAGIAELQHTDGVFGDNKKGKIQ
jgi:hypothetical protein